MKIKTALIASVLAIGLSFGLTDNTAFAAAHAMGGGKIEKVENGGRSVTIGGKKYKVSGSRTKITVKGKKAKRSALKVGMSCAATGKGEAKTISCK